MKPKDEGEDLMRALSEAKASAGAAPEALRSLYRKYGGLVFGVALRIVGDASTAEEVTQDVFLRAWMGAASYRGDKGSAATWLGRIARNRALDALRSARARGALARDDWSELEDDKALAPEEAMENESRAIEVRAAVSELPEAQRLALSLAFFRGMSHSEIAAELALPLGTVKSRIRDAMRTLREKLGEGGAE
jgi:RNA polymerase sigma-70 factor, ECF subfamily